MTGMPEARIKQERPDDWRVLAVLSTLLAFASISTDLYLPAMPAIATDLRAGASAMEFTVSAYLAGFCLGQLFWGPVGDRHGRRVPIALGVVAFIAGSVGCALAPSVGTMTAWRVVQAAGASAGVVLARAIVRDMHGGDRGAQVLSTLMTVMAVAPLVGPTVGGQLLALGGWRAIFWTLVGVGALTLASLAILPETLPPERRSREPLTRSLSTYARLLRDSRLLALAGTGGFFYAGTFAYIAASPFAYIEYHGVSPQLYGVLFGAGIVGIMAANQINARLVTRVGSLAMLCSASAVAAAAGLALAACASTGFGGLFGLVAPMFVFVAVTGVVVANAVALALDRHPDRAGAVSALVGAVQYGSGMLGSALVGVLADGTPRPLGWIVGLAAMGTLACALAARRGERGAVP